MPAAYVLTEHARLEMSRRGITVAQVDAVVCHPEQRWEVRPGRQVLQSRLAADEEGKEYLLRVFLGVDREPPDVVTAYRTSKVGKYWR